MKPNLYVTMSKEGLYTVRLEIETGSEDQALRVLGSFTSLLLVEREQNAKGRERRGERVQGG